MLSLIAADPANLYAKFKNAISNNQITEWREVAPDRFTHASERWAWKATLKASVQGNELLFLLDDVVAGAESAMEIDAFYRAAMQKTFMERFAVVRTAA